MRRLLRLLALTALPATADAQVFADDFDDGSDDGWERSSPLAGFGVDGIFTFPEGNTYRIRTDTPSPQPDTLGPARTGSYRPDVTQTSFKISVDIVAWSDERLQDFGILARMDNPGLGTLDAYSLSYDNNSGGIFMNRLRAEAVDDGGQLGQGSVFLEPGRSYRLVFHGFGGEFLGEIFDLEDLTFPLATAFGFEGEPPFFESGSPGLFNSGLTSESVPDALTDSTFDNFRASPNPDTDTDTLSDPWEASFFPSIFTHDADDDPDNDGRDNGDEHSAGSDPTDPGSFFAATSVEVAGGTLTITATPAHDDRTYWIELSTTLGPWAPAPAGTAAVEDGVLTITTPAPAEPAQFARVAVSYEP